MPFHQGLLRQNHSLETRMQYCLEIVTCDPLNIYALDHPDFIVYSPMENSIGKKRVIILQIKLIMSYRESYCRQNGIGVTYVLLVKVVRSRF